MDDLACLNYSHLDAGVCVALRGEGQSKKADTPTKMRCLPSFLVIGAQVDLPRNVRELFIVPGHPGTNSNTYLMPFQKAGTTDLRGLLSFHPHLDGPASEVIKRSTLQRSHTRAAHVQRTWICMHKHMHTHAHACAHMHKYTHDTTQVRFFSHISFSDLVGKAKPWREYLKWFPEWDIPGGKAMTTSYTAKSK